MPTLQLYTQPIREIDQTRGSSATRPENSLLGLLNSDPGAGDRVSTPPGEKRVVAQLRGRYADLMVDELDELAGASGFEEIPVFARQERTAADGYYLIGDASGQPIDPREPRLQQVDLSLSRTGTRTSHYRAVTTNPQPVDNPFGSDSGQEIAVSIRTSNVQWYDDATEETEAATVQRTVIGEHDDLDIYDTTEPSFSSPTLIYSIPYSEEWPTDCRVWDDYGRDKVDEESTGTTAVGSATVGSATVSGTITVASTWQRVFVTDHDWTGHPVLETDRLRLVPDEADQCLRAYRWDGETYAAVQLGTSPWRLAELDLTHVGPAMIEAQTEWVNVDTGDRHRLNLALGRGDESVLWTVPVNGSTPPQGLVDRLDPIAQTTEQATAERPALVKRAEVRE